MAQEANPKCQVSNSKKMNQISDLYIKSGKTSQQALEDREIWNNLKQQFDKIETNMSDVVRRKEKLAKMQKLYDESVAKKHSQLAEFEKMVEKLDKELTLKDKFSESSVAAANEIIDILKDDEKEFTKTELLMGKFRDFKVKIPNRIKDLLQAKKDISANEKIVENQENVNNNKQGAACNDDNDSDDMLDID